MSATADVARIVGVEMVVQGQVIEHANGLATVAVDRTRLKGLSSDAISTEVYVCIRDTDVVVEQAGSGMISARNHLRGRVSNIVPQGVMGSVTIDCGFPLTATVTRGAVEALHLLPGTSVVAGSKPERYISCRDRSAERENSRKLKYEGSGQVPFLLAERAR
ncbi:MAG: TOBE domain-containing protein [Nitrospiraceae bacterium]